MSEILKDSGTTKESVSDGWKEIWTPRIMKQASLEKSTNSKLNSVTKLISFNETVISSLLILPYLVKDPRCGPDHTKILRNISMSTDIEDVIDKNQSEPYILTIGELENPTQIFIIVEKDIFTEIKSFQDVVYGLMSSFFVLNLCYPHGCNNVYLFLESILGLSSKLPASVTHFITSLQSHS
jgi:hypothetical protein